MWCRRCQIHLTYFIAQVTLSYTNFLILTFVSYLEHREEMLESCMIFQAWVRWLSLQIKEVFVINSRTVTIITLQVIVQIDAASSRKSLLQSDWTNRSRLCHDDVGVMPNSIIAKAGVTSTTHAIALKSDGADCSPSFLFTVSVYICNVRNADADCWVVQLNFVGNFEMSMNQASWNRSIPGFEAECVDLHSEKKKGLCIPNVMIFLFVHGSLGKGRRIYSFFSGNPFLVFVIKRLTLALLWFC